MADAHSRRTYLIDRSFQLRYMALLAGWGIVLALLFGAWAWQAHRQAAEILARDPAQLALLHQSDRLLLWALAAIGLLTAAALALLAAAVVVVGAWLAWSALWRPPPPQPEAAAVRMESPVREGAPAAVVANAEVQRAYLGA